jgi:hypothetical protein
MLGSTSLQTTGTNTALGANPCNCDALPFPHLFLIVDSDNISGPFFSRKGLGTFAEKVLVEEVICDDEIGQVKEFFETIALPEEMPILDMAAASYELLAISESPFGDHPSTKSFDEVATIDVAKFVICPNCGQHGVIYDEYNRVLSAPRSKEKAYRDLNRFVSEREINVIEGEVVRKQIKESSLPEKDEPGIEIFFL